MIARARKGAARPRRTNAGLTLVEMMVAVSVFMGVLVMVVSIQTVGNRADRNMTLQDQVYEQAIVAAAMIQDEFKSSLVESIPLSRSEIFYRKLAMESDVMPALDGMGLPSWDSTLRIMKLDSDKRLIIVGSPDERPLARLGNAGRLEFGKVGTPPPYTPDDPFKETEFFWPNDVLEVLIHSEVAVPGGIERNAVFEMTIRCFLRNQHVR